MSQQRTNLVDLIVVRTAGSPEQLQQLRQQLAGKSTAELNAMADEQTLEHYRAQAARQVATEQNPRLVEAEQQLRAAAEKLAWSRIFGTVVNGRVATENQANRSIISSWINFDEQISPEWFKQVLAENPTLANALTWQSMDVLDPKKRQQAVTAQAEADRKIFEKVCRNYGLSTCEANFSVLQGFLQDDFSEYNAGQAIASQAVSLVPASSAEIQQRTQQAAKERQDYLINRATPEELRAAVQMEREQRRQEAQQEFVRQQDEAGRKREAELGLLPLPEFDPVTGEKWDIAFFNKLSAVNREQFRSFIKRFGGNQIVDRMRGIR